MRITKEEIVDRQITLSIELEDGDLEPYLERGYHKIVNKVDIPGFRKGKAPRQIVQQRYGKEGLLNDIWDHLAQDVTNKAIDSEKLDASGLPKIELLDLSPVTVKAVVPLTPQVELGDYNSINVPLEPVDITDEDVAERVEAIRSSTATWEPVGRSPKMGDLVTVTILCVVDGQKWIDQQDASLVLDAKSDQPLPGFSKALTTATIGKPKEFTLTFPNDYPEAKFTGKKGQFTVTISEVKGKKLPKLNNEFAKGIGDGYETLAVLKDTVRQELVKETENKRDREHREQTLQALVESSNFDIPPILVDHEAEHVLNDREQTLARMNVRLDDYARYSGTTLEKLKEDAEQTAQGRLKRTFAMGKFAELENIEVPTEEVESRIKIAKENAEQTRLQQKKSPRRGRHRREEDVESLQNRESIRRAILMDKALERLTEISQNNNKGVKNGPESKVKHKTSKPKGPIVSNKTVNKKMPPKISGAKKREK